MAIGQRVFARLAVSILDLKQRASAIIRAAHGSPIVVIDGGKITAYLLPAATYQEMVDPLPDRAAAIDRLAARS